MSIELTVRIITYGLKLGPIGITIVITVTIGIYFTFYTCGRGKAVSGNTIQISKVKYRLYGVAALKPGQKLRSGDAGPISGFAYCRHALMAKIGDLKVCCREYPDAPDPLKRTVAICTISKGFRYRGEDIGRWLVRNGYAVADLDYMERNPIDNGAYAQRLLVEQAFAEEHRLGIHAGEYDKPREYARNYFRERWKEKGLLGEPTFRTVKELVLELKLELELEWKGEYFEISAILILRSRSYCLWALPR
ncbi:MAG: thermonuclease family protein [Alphaproteobacteria bacterium]